MSSDEALTENNAVIIKEEKTTTTDDSNGTKHSLTVIKTATLRLHATPSEVDFAFAFMDIPRPAKAVTA
jgi:hypothetical protein